MRLSAIISLAMKQNMQRTACYQWHQDHQGRLIDFAGWEMPVQYSSITEEHRAVRQAAGLFDIAHMGRFQFTGAESCHLLDYLLTNDVAALQPGQIRYSLMTNEAGGILDDVLVYRLEDSYWLVVNSSNCEKIARWIRAYEGGWNTQFHDRSRELFMLALQGPKSEEILAGLIDDDLSALGYYRGMETRFAETQSPVIITRTGYTGEDGFELVFANELAVEIWETLIERGSAGGLVPCGLGCRDTLRLEAGMPLYGHELSETIDPFTAGLGFAVKLDQGDFLGREALLAAKERTDRPVRVGLELDGRRIAREGATVCLGEAVIGEVTSGTFSPTLERSIAMAYVQPEFAELGSNVEVDIRGKRNPATVVKLPFYRRAR